MGLSELEPAELARTLREVQDYDTKILGLKRDIEGLEDRHRLGELRDELEGYYGGEDLQRRANWRRSSRSNSSSTASSTCWRRRSKRKRPA